MLEAPRIVDINGRPYQGPGDLLRAELEGALKPLVLKYARDREARAIIMDTCLTLAVVSLRTLGISLAQVQQNVRRIYESRGPGSVSSH